MGRKNLDETYDNMIEEIQAYTRDHIIDAKDVVRGWITDRDDPARKSLAVKNAINDNIGAAAALFESMAELKKSELELNKLLGNKIEQQSIEGMDFYNDLDGILNRLEEHSAPKKFILSCTNTALAGGKCYQTEIDFYRDITEFWNIIFSLADYLCTLPFDDPKRCYSDAVGFFCSFLAEKIPIIGEPTGMIKALIDFANLLDKRVQQEERLSNADDFMNRLEITNTRLKSCIGMISHIADAVREETANLSEI